MAIERKPENTAPLAAPTDFAAGAGGLGGFMSVLMGLIQSLFSGGDFMGSLQGLFSGGVSGGPSAANAGATSQNSPAPRTPSTAPSTATPAARQDFKASAGVYIPADPKFNSALALQIARTDNASVGYCAKGTANILERLGYPVTRGDAHNWDVSLPQNGWVRVAGLNPKNAPEGAVLVYDSDIDRGESPRNNGGGKYGHAEVVCFDERGNRVYVSDKARNNAGGTVPGNFVGVYVPRDRYEAMVAANPQLQNINTTKTAESAPAKSNAASPDGKDNAAKQTTALSTASLSTAFAPAAQGIMDPRENTTRSMPVVPTMAVREMALG